MNLIIIFIIATRVHQRFDTKESAVHLKQKICDFSMSEISAYSEIMVDEVGSRVTHQVCADSDSRVQQEMVTTANAAYGTCTILD